MCTFEQFFLPPFEERTIEEGDGRRTYVNRQGVTLRVRTDGGGSPPHEIDFAIKTPADYAAHRERLVGSAAARSDPAWLRDNGPAIRQQQDHPVAAWVHGPFAYLRELMGVENAMILPYTEPEMIRLILADHLDKAMAAAVPVIEACKPDMCFVWEDCCGSSGPFIAPTIFESMMAAWYRDWKDYLTAVGVPWVMLDTDGDPSPLVRLWYEAGVDCMQPWEVNAVDMLKFAGEFPEYVMMGGIYKHIFEPGDPAQVGRFESADVHDAIDGELERVVAPMVARGGYIASLDHWPNVNTTYEGFRYYCDRLAKGYGKANRVTRFEGDVTLGSASLKSQAGPADGLILGAAPSRKLEASRKV
jgi:uroporphyrinogen decarboxylase